MHTLFLLDFYSFFHSFIFSFFNMQKINELKCKEKIFILIYGDTFIQAACCYRCSVWQSELRMAKQPILVVVLLDLVLLDLRESLSSLV
jgi:hypothetical protein